MLKLGFTFYPKDWWTSDTFFLLDPPERYLYLELLFMMYANDGYVQDNKALIEARLRTVIAAEAWNRITSLMVNENGRLTHPNVTKRLSKAAASRENGKKGGRPRKDREKTVTEREENGEHVPDSSFPKGKMAAGAPLTPAECREAYLLDTQQMETICMLNRLKVEEAVSWLEIFTEKLLKEGVHAKSLGDYKSHFSRWLDQQLENLRQRHGADKQTDTRGTDTGGSAGTRKKDYAAK